MTAWRRPTPGCGSPIRRRHRPRLRPSPHRLRPRPRRRLPLRTARPRPAPARSFAGPTMRASCTGRIAWTRSRNNTGGVRNKLSPPSAASTILQDASTTLEEKPWPSDSSPRSPRHRARAPSSRRLTARAAPTR
ncbi:MAG: hypothetical protein DME04_07425 [Candidatus Rokuibacteriota bacterium]|nr:MAG: hypothetical protein DME04_07425 [Candidatus Rokubacteria bacterium]